MLPTSTKNQTVEGERDGADEDTLVTLFSIEDKLALTLQMFKSQYTTMQNVTYLQYDTEFSIIAPDAFDPLGRKLHQNTFPKRTFIPLTCQMTALLSRLNSPEKAIYCETC